ncbi:MAG: CorA family divalent cation transporter [Actinomycetota bacterium]
MVVDRELVAGLEPGLRFAMLMTADGHYVDLTWNEVQAWKPADGFLWVHLERDDPVAQDWVRARAGLDPLVAMALLAEESRPRVEDVDDDLLVVLRGVNRLDPAERAAADIDCQLVPVHIWMEAGRCISLRDKAHSLTALRDLRLSMMTGKGPRSAGALMARIAEKVADHLGDLASELEDEVSELEDRIAAGAGGTRAEIAELRRRVVQFRRYLAPQRDALYRLRHDDASWLTEDAKKHLREVNDRLVRHLEDLDEIRQRASILQEELVAMVAEQTNRNTYALSIVTVVMLPMTFITGYFGMNTGALPFGTEHPFGTLIATLIIVAVGLVTTLLLRWVMRGGRS